MYIKNIEIDNLTIYRNNDINNYFSEIEFNIWQNGKWNIYNKGDKIGSIDGRRNNNPDLISNNKFSKGYYDARRAHQQLLDLVVNQLTKKEKEKLKEQGEVRNINR